MSRRPATKPASPDASAGRSLWLWVGAAFLFLALLWTGMILAARSTPIETVPLAPHPPRH